MGVSLGKSARVTGIAVTDETLFHLRVFASAERKTISGLCGDVLAMAVECMLAANLTWPEFQSRLPGYRDVFTKRISDQ